MVSQEPKIGRPRARRPKRFPLNIRIELDTQAALVAYADRRGIERPQAVRELLRVALGLEAPR